MFSKFTMFHAAYGSAVAAICGYSLYQALYPSSPEKKKPKDKEPQEEKQSLLPKPVEKSSGGILSIITSAFVTKTIKCTAIMTVMGILAPGYRYHLACIGAGLGAHALVDGLAARHSPARWWLLHALGNFTIVAFSLRDVYRCVVDPVVAASQLVPYSYWPMYVCGALHTYHTVAFHNLTLDDWVHHLVFAGVIVFLGLTFRGGPGTNLICFFVCGLPGGLDYVMLSLVKHNMMSGNTEKRFNARINVWLRAPGCVFIAYTYYISFLYSGKRFTPAELLAATVAMFLVFMNGQYYMQRVVGNAYQKDDTINKIGC